MNAQIPLWVIFTLLAAAVAANAVWNWIADQYEFKWFGVTRRWYGTHAHIRLRSDDEAAEPQYYYVVDWMRGGTAVPWLLAEHLGAEDEPEPLWLPVTDFAPHTVRKFRPHLIRCVLRRREVTIPWLTAYLPLEQPSGYLGEVRDVA